MQFDQNRIVIRERSLLDQFDLALFVVCAYAVPLSIALAIGIVPAMLLNAWLLADFAEPNLREPFPVAYVWLMLFLVIWEIPLATSVATLYLGEAVFQERPRPLGIAKALLRALPQLIWFQVVVRGFLAVFGVTLLLPCINWPYLNEVILLERNPIRRRKGRISTFRRSTALHGGSLADLFARFLASVGFGFVLFVALWISMQAAVDMMINQWEWSTASYTVYGPLALWIVIGYFTVVRLLGYLDLRIRREGWEVELLLCAEGERLQRQMT